MTALQRFNRRKCALLFRELAAAADLPPHSALFSQQLLDLTHRWWIDRREDADIDINDVHSLAALVYIHIKLYSARYPDPALFQLPDPRQPARSLTDFLTAVAALLAWRQPHNAPLLHSARTVHEVIAEENRILQSVNYELGTHTPGEWVKIFEVRFSLRTGKRGPVHRQGQCPRPPILPGFQTKSHREFCLVPLLCVGSVSNRPESTGDKAALVRSVSSGACPLALPTLLCLALPSQRVWSRKVLLCIFSPQLGPVDWCDLSHSCVSKKTTSVGRLSSGGEPAGFLKSSNQCYPGAKPPFSAGLHDLQTVLPSAPNTFPLLSPPISLSPSSPLTHTHTRTHTDTTTTITTTPTHEDSDPPEYSALRDPPPLSPQGRSAGRGLSRPLSTGPQLWRPGSAHK